MLGDVTTLTIVGWLPARLNEQLNNRWKKGRLKKRDRQRVNVAARFAKLPRATVKRRVQFTLIFGKGVRQGDPDAYLKSGLDALVYAGLLRGDTFKDVETMPIRPGRTKDAHSITIIELQDLE